MGMTRRDFTRLTLSGAPALSALWRGTGLAAHQAATTTSRPGGIAIGLNVPYSLGIGNNIAAEDLLTRLVEVGVGSVELRVQPVEHFLGSPDVRAAAETAKKAEAARASGQFVPT